MGDRVCVGEGWELLCEWLVSWTCKVGAGGRGTCEGVQRQQLCEGRGGKGWGRHGVSVQGLREGGDGCARVVAGMQDPISSPCR